MKRFHLIRDEDVSGTSGVGVVAQGVEFDDGTVALRWLTDFTSTAIYKSMSDVLAIHGHGGATWLSWNDALHPTPEAVRMAADLQRSRRYGGDT